LFIYSFASALGSATLYGADDAIHDNGDNAAGGAACNVARGASDVADASHIASVAHNAACAANLYVDVGANVAC